MVPNTSHTELIGLDQTCLNLPEYRDPENFPRFTVDSHVWHYVGICVIVVVTTNECKLVPDDNKERKEQNIHF